TAEPNASIELTLGTIIRTIKTAANGTWSASFTAAQFPADGTVNVTAIATDSSGNVSEPATRTFTIDTANQNPTIASVATDNVINAAEKAVNVTVTGQAEAGANVLVTLGGTSRNALANQSGVWVVNFPTAEIPDDTALTSVTAQSTDQAGNISVVAKQDIRIDTLKPREPLINMVSGNDSINADESTSSVQVSGTSEAGALVTVSWGTVTKTATADAEGVWQATFAALQLPPEGASIISATARDSALNVSDARERPVLIDTGTDRPVINTIAGNDVINATERTNGVLVSGKAEAGSTVNLVWGTVKKSPVALADGTWSQLFVASEIPLSGDNVITATPTDPFGNVGPAQTRNFSIDTIASPAVFNNVTGPDNTVNASEKSLGVQVTGTAEAGSEVVVTWGATAKSVTTDASGVWATFFASEQIPSDGVTPITAVVTDLAGNVSVQSGEPVTNVSVQSRQPVTIDATAPEAPVITSPIAVDNVVNSSERAAGVVVAGTAEANAEVIIAWGTISSKTVKADGAGAWSVTFASSEINTVGTASISATQRDVAGNTGPSSLPVSVIVNTGAPAEPFLDAVATNNIVNAVEKAAGVTISGTALGRSAISVNWGITKTVNANENGDWSIKFDAGEVPADGSPIVSVFQTDTLGNISSTTSRAITVDTAPPAVPVITSPIAIDNIINAAEKSATVTISGTAPNSTAVEVRIGGGTAKSVTSSGGGAWSVTFASGDLPADATGVLIEARTIDAAGNPSAWVGTPVTIDTAPPATPLISTVVGDDVINATERAGNIAVSGTAEAGAAVRVTWNGFVRNVNANTLGAWSTTYLSGELPSDGTSTITARATDAAGNANAVDGTRTVIMLTSLPGLPVIDQVAGDDRISINERTAGITVTGTATSNAKVAVTFGSTTHVVDANGSGVWTANFTTAQIAAEGLTRPITAVQTDVNGNVSGTATRNVEVDLTAPINFVVNQTGGVDGIVNATEKAAGVAVTGTATDAANIEVIWGVVTKTVAVTSGVWTAVFAASEVPADTATSTIRVTAIDTAGNRSVEKTSNVTIDTAPPATPVISTVAGDNVINATERAGNVIVNGTAEANAKLVITWNGIALPTTASDTGAWSVSFNSAQQPSSDGTSTITARATDAAGNANAVDGTRTVTTLTSPPGLPVIDQVAGDDRINIAERAAGITVTGTATSNAKVAVTFGSTTHVVDANGSGVWTANFTTAQIAAEGLTRPITAVQTDVNGNVSGTATRNVEVDLSPPTNLVINQTGGTDLTINAAEKAASVLVSGTTDAGNK
ncbi:MAG: beta strand repeat-containing protein, partial [Sphingomonadaceae bacterium]